MLFITVLPSKRKGEIVEKAVSRFKKGYVCSEAVLMTFAEFSGITSEIIPRIATGFGAGIGRRGSVCGALTGAITALGLKYGRDKAEDVEAYEKCQGKSFECYTRFKKEFGSVLCYDLIECDFTTPQGKKKFKELGIRDKKCAKFVESSMRTLLRLVEE